VPRRRGPRGGGGRLPRDGAGRARLPLLRRGVGPGAARPPARTPAGAGGRGRGPRRPRALAGGPGGMTRRPALQGAQRADVVVFGAGLTGCLAAWELARRGRRPLVLEAASVGSGATALDLGHVPTGPRLLYSAAIRRWGRDAARQAWEIQRENHDRLRETL